MTVRLTVKQLRLNHPNKPSQRVMGDYLGMTESNYRKLESNNLDSIKMSVLDKLVKYFQCNITDLLEYSQDTVQE